MRQSAKVGELALKASQEVALRVTQTKKPYTIAESLIHRCVKRRSAFSCMRCRRNFYSVSSCLDVASSEIFKVIDDFFREHDSPWPKCVTMCTDGARAMCDALHAS